MIPFEPNFLVRSASDLLADLTACRQLRHLTDADRASVIKYFFGDDEHMTKTKKYKGRYFAWTYEAFEVAFAHFGCACDACGDIGDIPEEKLRRCADRALANIDGRVKLTLCELCSRRFARFCERYFERQVRVPYDNDLEKMMIAWLAFEVRQGSRKLSHASYTTARHSENNRVDQARGNVTAHSRSDRRGEEHDHEISKAGERGRDFMSLRQIGEAPGLVLGTIQEVASEASVHG